MDAVPERPARGARTQWARWTKAILLLVALVVMVLTAARIVRWRRRSLALTDLSRATRDYGECLLGRPLATGETARARMRHIEAGLPEVGTGAASLAPEDAWPLRCRTDLDHAHAAIVLHGLARDPKMQALDALVLRVRVDPAPADAPDLVDQLFAAVTAVGLDASPRPYPPPTPHLAPSAASPLTAELVLPLPIHVRAVPDEVPGMDPLSLRLAFVDARAAAPAAWACTFSPQHGEPLREARCGEVKRGSASIMRDDDRSAPGYLRTARGGFDKFEVVRPRPDGDPDVTAVPSSAETAALYGDQLVWVTAHRWYARTVTQGRALLGPVVDLGEVIGESPELAACPTPTALVVGLKTFDEAVGENKSWRALAAREGGQWQRTPGKAIVDVGATLTCEGHAGTWTSFAQHVVTQVRCNADRCETHASDRVSIAWDVGAPLFAADLAGRVVVLGLGTTPGPLLGKSVVSVRMRAAPLSAIPNAPDVVLFSDQAHDGASISDVTVYVRGGVALVLLRGDDEQPYRAIRVDSLGEVSPIMLGD